MWTDYTGFPLSVHFVHIFLRTHKEIEINIYEHRKALSLASLHKQYYRDVKPQTAV